MRYNITINQEKCLELGVNLKEAAVLSLLNELSSWAEAVVVEGEVYYHLSRFKIIDELPFFFRKADTVYRVLKSLRELNLIDYTTNRKRDLVRLNRNGKAFNKSVIKPLKNSEKNPNLTKTRKKIRENSEKNPRNKKASFEGLQCLAYKNSEKNPTYNNNYTINNSLGEFLRKFKEENPVVFSGLFNSFTFLENLDKSLLNIDPKLNFQKEVIPVLFKWFESQYVAGGLNRNVSALRSQFVNYITAVITNQKKEVVQQEEINPFHAKVLRNAI